MARAGRAPRAGRRLPDGGHARVRAHEISRPPRDHPDRRRQKFAVADQRTIPRSPTPRVARRWRRSRSSASSRRSHAARLLFRVLEIEDTHWFPRPARDLHAPLGTARHRAARHPRHRLRHRRDAAVPRGLRPRRRHGHGGRRHPFRAHPLRVSDAARRHHPGADRERVGRSRDRLRHHRARRGRRGRLRRARARLSARRAHVGDGPGLPVPVGQPGHREPPSPALHARRAGGARALRRLRAAAALLLQRHPLSRGRGGARGAALARRAQAR